MTERFDRARLRVRPLGERVHDLALDSVLPLQPASSVPESLERVAERICRARKTGSSVVLIAGGHVVRSGVQKFLIDLIEKGYVSCVAMNGSVMIHDYELSLIGATTESVARYVKDGQFGLWKETAGINDIVNLAYRDTDLGMGAAVGRSIAGAAFPHRDISLLAACHRCGVPATVHIGIGYDIIHEHPNFDAAAAGAMSYRDFLAFTSVLERLEGGVVMNFGSAVMAPEVFLKALSMARNAAAIDGREIRRFTSLVCDLHSLPERVSEEPCREDPAYYFRPWKTMLVRTVADGGEGYYVRGRHRDTIPALWTAVTKIDG